MKLYTTASVLLLGLFPTQSMARVVFTREFQSFTPLIARDGQTFSPVTPGSVPLPAPPSSSSSQYYPSIAKPDHFPTDANQVIIGDGEIFTDLKLGECRTIQQRPPFQIENQSKFALFVTTDPVCNITGTIYPAPQGVVSLFNQGSHFYVATEDIYRLPWDQ